MTRPVLLIPRSPQVSQMIEAEPLSITPRAQRVGIVVIMPRRLRAADVMVMCHYWPTQLRRAGVTRVAVVLGLETYATSRLLLPGCEYKLREAGISVAFFHEGHLESDQIHAWFEQRKPRRRVTTDALIKLSERYVERGDVRSAVHAVRLAEAAA